MRVLSEHPPIDRASEYNVLCSYTFNLIERIMFAPKNCYYHIEHHSYPSVPFFQFARTPSGAGDEHSLSCSIAPSWLLGIAEVTVNLKLFAAGESSSASFRKDASTVASLCGRSMNRWTIE
jgi:hypothetical protein